MYITRELPGHSFFISWYFHVYKLPTFIHGQITANDAQFPMLLRAAPREKQRHRPEKSKDERKRGLHCLGRNGPIETTAGERKVHRRVQLSRSSLGLRLSTVHEKIRTNFDPIFRNLNTEQKPLKFNSPI